MTYRRSRDFCFETPNQRLERTAPAQQQAVRLIAWWSRVEKESIRFGVCQYMTFLDL